MPVLDAKRMLNAWIVPAARAASVMVLVDAQMMDSVTLHPSDPHAGQVVPVSRVKTMATAPPMQMELFVPIRVPADAGG